MVGERTFAALEHACGSEGRKAGGECLRSGTHQPSPIKADFIVFSRPSQSWEGDVVSLNRSIE